MIGAFPGLRVCGYQRGGQARQRVPQAVLGADGDLVGLDRAGTGLADHRVAGSADGARSTGARTQHPGRRVQRLLHLIDQGRVNRVITAARPGSTRTRSGQDESSSHER